MRLIIKNKFFSLGGSSVVTNENNEIVYKVKGSIWGRRLLKICKKRIKDMNKKTLFVVRNKFWHAPFRRSALIFQNGKKLAVVTTSHYIKNGYEVKGATEPIKIEGTGWNLDIMLGDKKIGHISLPGNNNFEKYVRLTDAYQVEFDDPEDASFMVAMIIAIDNIVDRKRNER